MKTHDQLTDDLILLQRFRYLCQRYEFNYNEWLSAYESGECPLQPFEVDKMHDKFTTMLNCVNYVIKYLEKEL